MRYIAYERASDYDPARQEHDQYQVVAQGSLTDGGEVRIPIDGYVSVEVAPGCWLTSRTSEWGEVSLGTRPAFPDAPAKPPPRQWLYRCGYCGDEHTAERAPHCKACSWLPMMRLVGPAPTPAPRPEVK
jgi:hypothetical protein